MLIVHVPARSPGPTLQYEGAYWMRAGDALVPMGDQRLREIFLEGGPDFSAERSSAIIANLDPTALAEFRNRWSRKSPGLRIGMEAWSDEALLEDAELRVDGRTLGSTD